MSDASDFPQIAAQGAFLTEEAPDHAIPDGPMTPIAAMRLLGGELAVEGVPERNLATFVTTWVPAYTMPPNAQDVKMMRALVKLNLSRSLVNTLGGDIDAAIQTLEEKGPASESERKRVKTSVTH